MLHVRRRTLTFLNTYPPQYVTTAELKAEDLCAADNQLPAALFRFKGRDWESVLYARADATPVIRGELRWT